MHAVDRVSLEVADHEFVTVVGPSGCGKSTLLRILAGLTPATEGRASVLAWQAEAATAAEAWAAAG